jgi:hypothetical protein
VLVAVEHGMVPGDAHRKYGWFVEELGIHIVSAKRCPGEHAGGITGTKRDVSIYERFGFRVIDYAHAPNAGPRIWFMRWDQ